MRRMIVGAGAVLALGLGSTAGALALNEVGFGQPEDGPTADDRGGDGPQAPAWVSEDVNDLPIPPTTPDHGDDTHSDGLGGYPDWDGYDLDCADVGDAVEVRGDDPHGLDDDGDDVGCDVFL